MTINSANTITSEFTVLGMTCGHCVSSVTEEVSSLPDVQDVAVDLSTGSLRITSTKPVEAPAVRSAVEEAGYALAEES